MRVIIDIPEEFEGDFCEDRFNDFFERVIADMGDEEGMCGKYEKENAEMLMKAFNEAIVGEVNQKAKVIPIANISFDEDKLREIVREEIQELRENNM